MQLSEIEAKAIVGDIAARRAEELRSALGQLRGSLEINLSVWSGPEQIPIELLQNADDAFEDQAPRDSVGSILYRADDKYLLVAHDGPPFTPEDVDYISSIGRPHKRPGRQSGWMDFGFKSVFQLTNEPMVFSGPFRFKFEYERAKGNAESILIPVWVEEIPHEVKETYFDGWTVFYLPFRSDLAEVGEFSHRLDFAPLSLAFLRHIRRIRIETKFANKEYVIKPTQGDVQAIDEVSDGHPRRHAFRLFSRSVPIPKDIRNQDRVVRSGRGSLEETVVSLAFRLNENNDLVPTEGQLYYFVPTTIRTGLKFDVNGDFLLNAERTAVDRGVRWNEHLLKTAGDLVLEAVGYFRRHKRWRYQFYELLPTGGESSEPFERSIVEPVRQYCLTHPVIISHENKWLMPAQIAIVPKRLHKVLEPAGVDLQGFLNPKASGLDFIRSLQVEDFSDDEEGDLLIRFISDNAARIRSMPAKWFVRLYSYLAEALFNQDPSMRMKLWYLRQSQIRELRVVLAENKNVVRPKDAVYPSRVRGIPKTIAKRLNFVHPEVIRARGVRRVLVDGLGVPVFSAASAVDNLVREAEQGTARRWSNRERWEAFRFIHRWLKGQRWDVSAALRRRLPHLLVPTTDTWVAAGKAYLGFAGLDALLPEAPVAMLPQGRQGDSKTSWENTLQALGVVAFPRVNFLEGDFTHRGSNALPEVVQANWDDYWQWLGRSEVRLYEYTSYQRLQGVQWASWLARVPALQPELRRQVLEVILHAWNSYYRHFLETRYEWFYYTDQHKQVASFFSWQLRHEQWLPTTHGVVSAAHYVLAPLSQVRAVIGDLAPYVDCEEALARNSRSFFEQVGVKADLDRDTLISLLRYLQARQLPTEYWTDHRLGYLKEVYRLLAQQIDEGEFSEEILLPLLGEDKRFRDSQDLVWKDDPEVGAVFPEFERYAWVPAVERPLIERLFQAAGVQPVSRLVDVTVVGDGAWEPLQWSAPLRAKGDFLYSLVAHHRSEAVESLLRLLQDVPHLMGHLALRLKLIWNDDSRLILVPAYFQGEPACLHLSQDASPADVAFALAKGLGIPEQTEQVERILTEEADELRRRFGRWEIAIVPVPQQRAPTEETPGGPVDAVTTAPVGPSEAPPPTEVAAEDSVLTSSPEAEKEPSVPLPETEQKLGRSDSTHLVGPPRLPHTPRPHIPSVIMGSGATDAKARRLAELEAMRVATWYEERVRGRTVTDVSPWESYDLESVDPATPEKVERYIEVKAHFSTWPVELTDPEKERADTLGEEYWLYVVTRTGTGYALYMVQDPANSAQVDLQEHYTPIWRVAGWESASPSDVPTEAGDPEKTLD